MKGLRQYTTAFFIYMSGFYVYTNVIHQYMKAFLKYMTGFHKFYCTVPAAVRHITQTARAKHNQSLREEPSSPSRSHQITMTFDPGIIIKGQAN
jgi:phage-related protein